MVDYLTGFNTNICKVGRRLSKNEILLVNKIYLNSNLIKLFAGAGSLVLNLWFIWFAIILLWKFLWDCKTRRKTKALVISVPINAALHQTLIEALQLWGLMHRSIVWLQGIMKCEMVIEDQQQDEVSFSTEISQPTDP